MIGNLPYYITSQILFTLADHSASVRSAVVTMQWEVAQRLVAKPRTKDYGILSVVFQLYAAPRVAFKIPPSAFHPAPAGAHRQGRDVLPVPPQPVRADLRVASPGAIVRGAPRGRSPRAARKNPRDSPRKLRDLPMGPKELQRNIKDAPRGPKDTPTAPKEPRKEGL